MSGEQIPEGDDYKNTIEHTFFGEDSEYEDAPVEEGHRRGRKVTIRLEDNKYYSPVLEERDLPRAPSRLARICTRLFPRNIRTVKCFFTGVMLVIFLFTWILSQLIQYYGPTIVYYFKVNLFLTMISEGKTVEDYEKVVKEM